MNGDEMGWKWAFTSVLEIVFGILYTLALHKTRIGQYLKYQLTWITVVIGVAGTGLIGAIVLGWETVGQLALLFTGSAIGVIGGELALMERQFRASQHELKRDD